MSPIQAETKMDIPIRILNKNRGKSPTHLSPFIVSLFLHKPLFRFPLRCVLKDTDVSVKRGALSCPGSKAIETPSGLAY